MAKKSKLGARYTAAQKAKILAVAKREGLTGAQVAKRFGVSTPTLLTGVPQVRRGAVGRYGWHSTAVSPV